MREGDQAYSPPPWTEERLPMREGNQAYSPPPWTEERLPMLEGNHAYSPPPWGRLGGGGTTTVGRRGMRVLLLLRGWVLRDRRFPTLQGVVDVLSARRGAAD